MISKSDQLQESLSNWTPPPGSKFLARFSSGGSKLTTLNNNLQCTHIFTDKKTCFLTGTYVTFVYNRILIGLFVIAFLLDIIDETAVANPLTPKEKRILITKV